mmetsp:Transcript_91168/g.244094  ORF Transcript_91168/g.244094 Transcript_91168/m.244094 type:complete len:223 (+) Transcript_91168:83-751(+)
MRDIKRKGRAKGVRYFLFWHDADTHIMEPSMKLEDFLQAADYQPVVFTDNALSLNNGVFFLEYSKSGLGFFKIWHKTCRHGEWPWADNGCMYEAMLQFVHSTDYEGSCLKFRSDFNPAKPEPPTGEDLMNCFNAEMQRMGTGCCGDASRNISGIRFLIGSQSFNHHPCDEFKKFFSTEPADVVDRNCFTPGMFMVHTKDTAYASQSFDKVVAFTGAAVNEEL